MITKIKLQSEVLLFKYYIVRNGILYYTDNLNDIFIDEKYCHFYKLRLSQGKPMFSSPSTRAFCVRSVDILGNTKLIKLGSFHNNFHTFDGK